MSTHSTLSTESAPFRAPTILIGTLFLSALGYSSWNLGMWLVTGPSALLGQSALSSSPASFACTDGLVWRGCSGVWAMLFAHQGRVNKAGERKDQRSNIKKRMDKKDL